MEKRGVFLVFEGGEGSGKTTQAKLLAEALEKSGRNVLLTKEPGGDEGICRDIRKILLTPDYKVGMSERAELLLFEADRAQHVDKVILPALKSGDVVISDRYEAATYAYQCFGRGVMPGGNVLNEFATGGLRPDCSCGLRPDCTFWIDVNPVLGLQRNKDAKKRDRFELEDISFHNKVREGYQIYFRLFATIGTWQKFDGSLSIEELHRQIMETISTRRLV